MVKMHNHVVHTAQTEPSGRRLPRSIRVIYALMMREMATTYGRSALGYLWAILEPLGAILLLSIAFSVIFSAPALGDNFPLFYATGFIPFQIYMQVQNSVQFSIHQNRQLLFYPEVSYIDAILARFLLVLIAQCLVALLIFGGIITVFELRPQIDYPTVLRAIGISALLGLGVGTFNAVLFYLAPSWQQVWTVLNRPLFIASCIFYLFDSLPLWVQNILWFNPLVHVVGEMRTGLYSYYVADYVSLLYPLVLAAGLFLAGLVLLKRYAKDMINL